MHLLAFSFDLLLDVRRTLVCRRSEWGSILFVLIRAVTLPRQRQTEVYRTLIYRTLSNPDQTLHGLDQFLRIIPDTVFEDDLHLFDIGDGGSGISFYDHQISLFTD